jgi:hypothetical protein
VHLGNHIDPFLAGLITILEIVSKYVPKSTPLFGKVEASILKADLISQFIKSPKVANMHIQ